MTSKNSGTAQGASFTHNTASGVRLDCTAAGMCHVCFCI